MKNVTISLDEDTAQWIRVQAATQATSVSRLVGEMLRKRRLEDAEYQNAMVRFLKRPTTRLKSEENGHPDQESLYDRPILR